jgi:hypothetical protein
MTRPWSEIESFYRELGKDALGMLRLVERINASCYASMLYAWTSMLELCIVQLPCTYPYDGPFLRISPGSDGTMEFRYIDTYVASRQWHRLVKQEDAFRRLELFLAQLHWVAREAKRDQA